MCQRCTRRHLYPVSALAVLATLAGYFAFRVLVFKVGLYDPLISFASES
ncbi:MAG: hypothetical protein ACREB3_09235 [Burkholderiales bacterium]